MGMVSFLILRLASEHGFGLYQSFFAITLKHLTFCTITMESNGHKTKQAGEIKSIGTRTEALIAYILLIHQVDSWVSTENCIMHANKFNQIEKTGEASTKKDTWSTLGFNERAYTVRSWNHIFCHFIVVIVAIFHTHSTGVKFDFANDKSNFAGTSNNEWRRRRIPNRNFPI